MIIAVDVGNTNTAFGIFKGRKLEASFKFKTDKNRTADEIGSFVLSMFAVNGLEPAAADAAIISSVVPPAMYSLEHAIKKYFKTEPVIVGPGVKTGLNIKYENPREVGADRIVNAVAAYESYGGPVIVVDFGTATDICAISARGEYLGGVICPGLKISADALCERTARLPKIELAKPAAVIGKNTVANMQSGLIYGHAGMVEHLVGLIRAEMNEPGAKVIATGGMATLVAGETKCIDIVNTQLTLEGLRLLYEKNHIPTGENQNEK